MEQSCRELEGVGIIAKMARINNNEPLTVEEILQKVFKEYDMIIRPKALVVSPRTKMALLEAEPTIEQRVVLIGHPACEDETAYLMDRKDVEKWALGQNAIFRG